MYINNLLSTTKNSSLPAHRLLNCPVISGLFLHIASHGLKLLHQQQNCYTGSYNRVLANYVMKWEAKH